MRSAIVRLERNVITGHDWLELQHDRNCDVVIIDSDELFLAER